MRPSQRLPEQLREIRITRNFTRHAEGSILIEMGDTRVLCNVTMSDKPREGVDFFPLSVE